MFEDYIRCLKAEVILFFRGSAVGIETRYGLDDWAVGVPVQATPRIFTVRPTRNVTAGDSERSNKL
jgi:hypothetical protein